MTNRVVELHDWPRMRHFLDGEETQPDTQHYDQRSARHSIWHKPSL
jgi:hypothetical protein